MPVQASPISGTARSRKDAAAHPKPRTEEDTDGQEDRARRAFPLPGLHRVLESDRRATCPRSSARRRWRGCTDFGETRLASMDKAGIARAVLALAGPGVQAERDTATAIRNAQSANDFLAREIQKRPDRYSGFAHLAMQDAKAAADELERCVTRAEVLRRHDQRPHQRPVSRPSLARAVLGARRGARTR